jgi:hypothetical protein
MTKEKNTWTKNGMQLSCFLDLNDERIIDTNGVDLYSSHIKKWQRLFCPDVFLIENMEIKNTGEKIEFCLFVNNISLFHVAEPLVYSLSSLEKLFICQRLININNYFEKNDLNLSWELSQLYRHSSGCYSWLPPTPDFLLNPVNSKKTIIDIFLNIFEIPINNSVKIDKLLRDKNLPIEWSIFIDYYLSQQDFEKVNAIFSFIFYQSWLYTSAHHVGMSGESSLKLLTTENYQKLYQLGINLGLSATQIKQLDFLANLPPEINSKTFIDSLLKL